MLFLSPQVVTAGNQQACLEVPACNGSATPAQLLATAPTTVRSWQQQHLATQATCAYRADPRRSAGSRERLLTLEREGNWCRPPQRSDAAGETIMLGARTFFLPRKFHMANSAVLVAPSEFACSKAGEARCSENEPTLVRLWGCVIARCWRAKHDATSDDIARTARLKP